MRFIKPLDVRRLRELARSHSLLVTLEDNSVVGGAGAAVAEFLAADAQRVALLRLGVPDQYVEHGTREESLAECGLTVEGLVARVRAESATQSGARRRREAKATVAHWLLPAEIG